MQSRKCLEVPKDIQTFNFSYNQYDPQRFRVEPALDIEQHIR